MNAFEKSAVEAENRGDRGIARRIRVEGKIATFLVAILVEKNFRVTINDGEEDVVVKSTNKFEIINSMFSTDEDYVIFYPKDNKERAGWFFLVYGNNGYDVISDYLAAPVCEAIYDNDIKPFVDALESGRN